MALRGSVFYSIKEKTGATNANRPENHALSELCSIGLYSVGGIELSSDKYASYRKASSSSAQPLFQTEEFAFSCVSVIHLGLQFGGQLLKPAHGWSNCWNSRVNNHKRKGKMLVGPTVSRRP